MEELDLDELIEAIPESPEPGDKGLPVVDEVDAPPLRQPSQRTRPVEEDREPIRNREPEPESEVDTSAWDDEETGIYMSAAMLAASKLGMDIDDEFEQIVAENPGEAFEEILDIYAREQVEKSFANPKIKELNEYVKRGGSIEDFIRQESDIPDLSQYSLNTPEDQADVIADYLAITTNMSESEITDYINLLFETNRLTSKASEIAPKFVKAVESMQQRNQQQREQQFKEQQARHQEFIKGTVNYVQNNLERDLNINLSTKDKQNFLSFYFDKDSSGKTKFEKKLDAVPNAYARLAFLVYSGMMEGKIPKMAETKAKLSLRETLSNSSKNTNSKITALSAMNNSKNVDYDDFMQSFYESQGR